MHIHSWAKASLAAPCVAALIALSATSSLAQGGSFAEGKSAYEQSRYQDAFNILKPLAEAGNAPAQHWLGNIYYYGLGETEKDDAEAARWFRKSAEAGYAAAQYRIGYMHAMGSGMEQDHRAAARWWGQAAKQGHMKAILRLAKNYSEGRYLPKNERLARHWYRQAAVRGSREAMLQLALNLMGTETIPRDYRRAYTWLLIAQAKGSGRAAKLVRQFNSRFYDAEVMRGKEWADVYLRTGKLPPRMKNEM
jgi:TPR repeat protein